MGRKGKKLVIAIVTIISISFLSFNLLAADQVKGSDQIVSFTIGQQSYQQGGTTVRTDVAPYIKDDRTLVPVAFVAPALGTDNAVWNPVERTVKITKGNDLIIIKIGSKELVVNGKVLLMDTAAEIKDIGDGGGRTMLPIAFIARALNIGYQWDGNTRSVDFYGYSETYGEKGIYGSAQGLETIMGNVTIAVGDVTLQNKVIKGNLIIAESVGDGDVFLNNITVLGNTFVRGGGKNSIHIDGGSFQGNVVIEDTPEGGTRVVVTNVQGVSVVVATGEAGEEVVLEGTFSNVEITATDAVVSTQGQTTIENIVVNNTATVTVAAGTTVTNVTLNTAATVTGGGTVTTANVNADDVVISTTTQPTVNTATGVTPPTSGPTTPAPPTSSSGDSSGGGGGTSTTAVSALTVTGEAKVGTELTATPTPAAATGTYQWTISATVDGTYANIAGATTNKYTPVAGDAGKFVKATITASGSYIGTQTSAAKGPIAVEAVGSLAYGEGLFIEVPGNNGAIDGPLEITLSGDTFTGVLNDDFVADGKATVSHTPAGMTAEVRRKTATTVWLILMDSATSHAEADDISNLTITFQDSAFNGGSGAAITNSIKSDLRVDFHDPAVTSIADFANTTKTSTTATFTWTAAAGASAVKIQQMNPGDILWTDSVTGALAVDAATATVTGLTASTDYVFRLVVTGGNNAGISSTVENVTTEAGAAVAGDLITSVTGTSNHAAGDTIVLAFSEDLNQASAQDSANWKIQYTDDNSGTNAVNITITNAIFVYSAASDELTVTLDEATDQAFIPHNKFVSVVPANTSVKNADGSKYVDNTSVKYSVAVGKEDTEPTISSAWSKTNATTFTVTYNEVLNRTAATNTDYWHFSDANNGGTTISGVALSADGRTVTVSLSGGIEGYDQVFGPEPVVADLAGNPAAGGNYVESGIRLNPNEIWASGGGPGAMQGHFDNAIGLENNYSVSYNDVEGTYWNGGAAVNIKTARGSDYTNAITHAVSVADVGNTANGNLKVFFIELDGSIDNLTNFVATPCQMPGVVDANPRNTLYLLGQRTSGAAVNARIKLYVRDTENNIETHTYLNIKSATDPNGDPTGVDIIANPHLETGNEKASIIGAYNYTGDAGGCTVNINVWDTDGSSILTPTLTGRIKITHNGSIVDPSNYTIDDANDTITFTQAYLDANYAALAANDESIASQQFFIEFYDSDAAYTADNAFAAQIVDIY